MINDKSNIIVDDFIDSINNYRLDSDESIINKYFSNRIDYLSGCWNVQLDFFLRNSSNVTTNIVEYENLVGSYNIITVPLSYMYWLDADSIVSPLFWNLMREEKSYIQLLNSRPKKTKPGTSNNGLKEKMVKFVHLVLDGGLFAEQFFVMKKLGKGV